MALQVHNAQLLHLYPPQWASNRFLLFHDPALADVKISDALNIEFLRFAVVLCGGIREDEALTRRDFP